MSIEYKDYNNNNKINNRTSYTKTFRNNNNNHNNILLNYSTPKNINIKILPKIQHNNIYFDLPYRYIQTPKNQIYHNRLKLFKNNNNNTSSLDIDQQKLFFNNNLHNQKKNFFQNQCQNQQNNHINIINNNNNKINKKKSIPLNKTYNQIITIQDDQEKEKNKNNQEKNVNINSQKFCEKKNNINNVINNNINANKFYVLNRKGKRPYNEDRYICKTNLQKFYFLNNNNNNQINTNKSKNSKQYQQQIDFYSVFDGHGGSVCADYLKDNFINFLLRSKNLQTNPQQTLKQAYQQAQQKFINLCESKRNNIETSGACAISCLIIGNKITIASVGDCRAIMFNKQYLCQMTKDHKPTQISQKMRIIKCGGKIYKQQMKLTRFYNNGPVKNFQCVRIAPGNLNVSRTIGDIQAKLKKYGGLPGMISPQPQIKTFDKQNYQILLLASDGLFQAFSNKQIQQFYYKNLQYEKRKVISSFQFGQKFIQALMEEAQLKSTDNITIIVVMLNNNIYAVQSGKQLEKQNFIAC